MMSRNTVIRSMHDLGAAAWFGGSLMGASGLNGAASAVHDPQDRVRVASAGWATWAPINAAAIGAHLIGGAGILYANRDRAKHQSGVGTNTAIKLALTAAALAGTAYSGFLGTKTAQGQDQPAHGATDPAPTTSDPVASAQRQLKYLQWSLPILTGGIIILGAQQGEQQRATSVLSGVGATLAHRMGSQ